MQLIYLPDTPDHTPDPLLGTGRVLHCYVPRGCFVETMADTTTIAAVTAEVVSVLTLYFLTSIHKDSIIYLYD